MTCSVASTATGHSGGSFYFPNPRLAAHGLGSTLGTVAKQRTERIDPKHRKEATCPLIHSTKFHSRLSRQGCYLRWIWVGSSRPWRTLQRNSSFPSRLCMHWMNQSGPLGTGCMRFPWGTANLISTLSKPTDTGNKPRLTFFVPMNSKCSTA